MTNDSVTGVGASAYRVPTDGPEADGTFAWDSTTLVVVTVAAAGTNGTGWTYAPAATVRVVDELLAPVVIGRDPGEVEGAWDQMVRAVRNAGRPGVVGMAPVCGRHRPLGPTRPDRAAQPG
jgi:L-alanine-DL-glutamate epimerase-like enolase superfamily enzyme